MYSHLAELQASPHVGHFSHLSPDAPATEQTHWPHSHLPLPLQTVPSSDVHASALVLQLQYSPVQPLWQWHSPQSHTPWPEIKNLIRTRDSLQKYVNNQLHYFVITHLHRALHGIGHRNNCHTRSTVRRCAQSWRPHTHIFRSSTAPDHYISRIHCLLGSYSTKHSPHCIRTALPGTRGNICTRHTGKSLGFRCNCCCLLLEAASSHMSKETPVAPLNCPVDPAVWGRSGEHLTDILRALRTRWTPPEMERNLMK